MKHYRSSEEKTEIINRRFAIAKERYNDYISLGTLEKVGRKHGVTKGALSRLFKRNAAKGIFKYPPKELHLENVRNIIIKDYENLIRTLGRHPTTTEMRQHVEWKNIYHRIIYRYYNLSKFKETCGYPIPQKEETERMRISRANQLYRDYIFLGTLERVGKAHRITKERVRQILKKRRFGRHF